MYTFHRNTMKPLTVEVNLFFLLNMSFPFLDSCYDSFALDFVLFFFSLYYFPFPFRGHILFFQAYHIYLWFFTNYSLQFVTLFTSVSYIVHTDIYQMMPCLIPSFNLWSFSLFSCRCRALTCWRAYSHAFKNNPFPTHTLSTHAAHSACTVVLHRGLRATLECGTPGANPCTAGDRGMCQRRPRVDSSRVDSCPPGVPRPVFASCGQCVWPFHAILKSNAKWDRGNGRGRVWGWRMGGQGSPAAPTFSLCLFTFFTFLICCCWCCCCCWIYSYGKFIAVFQFSSGFFCIIYAPRSAMC